MPGETEFNLPSGQANFFVTERTTERSFDVTLISIDGVLWGEGVYELIKFLSAPLTDGGYEEAVYDLVSSAEGADSMKDLYGEEVQLRSVDVNEKSSMDYQSHVGANDVFGTSPVETAMEREEIYITLEFALEVIDEESHRRPPEVHMPEIASVDEIAYELGYEIEGNSRRQQRIVNEAEEQVETERERVELDSDVDRSSCPVEGCAVQVSSGELHDHCIEVHGWWNEQLMMEFNHE